VIYIFINPFSCGGKSLSRWKHLKDHLPYTFKEIFTESTLDLHQKINSLSFEEKETVLASAGGDGGVHELINAVMNLPLEKRKKVVIGAIALGSSNDFHKPINPHQVIQGISVKLDHLNFQQSDLGHISIKTTDQKASEKHFIINASLGLTAKGNNFFNKKTFLLSFFKKIHVELANFYTFIFLIKNYQLEDIELTYFDLDKKIHVSEKIKFSNLAILKKTHVSGGMKYDTPVTCDDGLFDITICEQMNRFEIIQTIIFLYQGIFKGRKKTRFFRTNDLHLKSLTPFLLESDGEITENVLEAKFRIEHLVINKCR
jgi:diacylglycerol kinase (ATP)